MKHILVCLIICALSLSVVSLKHKVNIDLFSNLSPSPLNPSPKNNKLKTTTQLYKPETKIGKPLTTQL